MTVDWTRYNYLTLGTRRRDGRRVFTPIWFAAASEGFFAFSSGDAGKVKRLRNFSDVEIAPCTVTGKPLAPAISTHAQLLTHADDIQRALDALHSRYGWQMRLIDWGAKLAGRYHKRAYLRIDPPATSARP
ncbi:MAG: PPOX class F420-dependent oxidoreductase [Spongiibacteraceae bacterium]|jgi:PPOX class probable F420-dependent enzyme|nr:PPOX class F420-dependent oxidoreductase [Spongiibacteraceae bacterium]